MATPQVLIDAAQPPATAEHAFSPRRCPRATVLLAYVALAVTAAVLFSLIKDMPPLGDELAHERQIRDLVKWLSDEEPFTPIHPAIPGYHFLLALISFATGRSSISFLRGASVMLNVLGLMAVYHLSFALSRDRLVSAMRMAQAFVLAVAFPFFFLLYTDILSVGVVLLSLALLFRGQAMVAGILGVLAMAIRQNNVLWLGLAFLLACLDPIAPPRSLRVREILSTLRASGRWWRTAPFLVGFLLFILFVSWNDGRIALGDAAAHPAFSFHTGNVWLCLFVGFVTFLPLGVAQGPAVVRLLRRDPELAFLLGSLTFALYMLTYVNTHPYNFIPWWLHNKVVLLSTSTRFWKALFFLPVLYQVLVFAVTPLWRRRLYLFYPIALVCLSASWLIEPRYSFIPLFLFLLFRRPATKRIEAGLLVWNALLALVLFYGAWQRLYLP